jgi:Snare region anchored in the vesicle membrane C-terminus./Vesicle transport v-SNARE protein N-terminus.
VRSIIRSTPSVTDDLQRTAALDQADKKLREIKSNARSFKAEIRLLPNPEERNRYKDDLGRYEQIVAELTTELKGLRSEGNRQKLFLGAQGGDNDVTVENDPRASGDALLDEAGRIQDKTQQSISNTKRMIDESKEVGMQTAEELQRQREQLGNIDSDVMRMENNLNRADRLIKTFGKRMATDKLIQCFACTNVVLLVGVVVYVVVKGGLDEAKNDGTPESPVDNNDAGTTEEARMLRSFLGW